MCVEMRHGGVRVYKGVGETGSTRKLLYYHIPKGTCCEADFHRPLSMPKDLKLGQRHLVGHPYRVGPFVPFIADIPHGVTDCK